MRVCPDPVVWTVGELTIIWLADPAASVNVSAGVVGFANVTQKFVAVQTVGPPVHAVAVPVPLETDVVAVKVTPVGTAAKQAPLPAPEGTINHWM